MSDNRSDNKKELKKYKGRRAYLNDFRANEKGEYEYAGAVYESTCPHGQYKSAVIFMWVCTILAFVFQIACGCIPAAGAGNTFYILIPYAATVFVCGLYIYIVAKLTAGGKLLREYVYNKTVKRIPIVALVGASFAAVTLCGEILYVIMSGMGEHIWATVLYFALQIMCAAAMLASRLALLGLPWEKIPQKKK